MHSANTSALNEDTLQPLDAAIRAVIPGGKNPSTSWRWITRGIAGVGGDRIKLKVWYVGRTPHTTATTVRKWLDAVTEARLLRMEHTRQRVADVSETELAAAGLLSTSSYRRRPSESPAN